MSRRAPGKVRSLADLSRIVFVLSILLAFGMRRGFAETRDQAPWLGEALVSLIVLSGVFVIATAVMRRKSKRGGDEDARPD